MSTKPTDELLDHNYDGIREFDNPIPAWWNWIFIGSIVFSMVYYIHYHVAGTGQGVYAAYEADMEQHRAMLAEQAEKVAESMSEEKLLAVMHEPEMVEAGKVKYDATCAACHGAKGEGLVGPNLTDPFWIHADGTLMSIREVVAQGVTEKGMPAWEKILTPEEMMQVVAYIGTMRGTNVEGKGPEGEAIGPAGAGGSDAPEGTAPATGAEGSEGESADS
jgi:cytochrome c oxidase cbb3-type subunit 3